MKTVLFIDESRTSINDTDVSTEGWVSNGDNYATGIRRQQSGSVVMIWGKMIGNELTILFRVPEELNCPMTCIHRNIRPTMRAPILFQVNK